MGKNLKNQLIKSIQNLEVSKNNEGDKILVSFKTKNKNSIFNNFSFFIKKIEIMGIETFILGETNCTIHSTYCTNDYDDYEEIAFEIIEELENIEGNCESEILGFSR